MQGFPNSFLEPPQHCTFFACFLYQSHLIQLISSLVATPRPEIGVSDKGDMQNVQCWGGSRNVFGNPWCNALGKYLFWTFCTQQMLFNWPMDLTYGKIQMIEPLELSAQFLWAFLGFKPYISAQLLLLFLILFKECIKYDTVVILGSITIQSLKIFTAIIYFKLSSKFVTKHYITFYDTEKLQRHNRYHHVNKASHGIESVSKDGYTLKYFLNRKRS